MRATTENLTWKDWNDRRLRKALKSSTRGMAGLMELRLGTSEGKNDTGLGLQAASWRGLEGFVEPARLAKILDLLVSPSDDARDRRYDDARSVPELIGHLFSAEVAAQLYVNSVQSRSRNSLRTQGEVNAMVLDEVERMRHPVLLFAPPLDPSESPDAPTGCQTFRLPRKICSPAALVMFARFDLTPPIDTDSDVYLSVWRQRSATNAEFKERLADGTYRPSAAFELYFRDALGTTCKETLGEDMEAILDEWRRRARRALPRLQRTSPAGTVEFMNKVVKMMSNVMVKGSKISAGLEGAVEHVTAEMNRGGTFSTILSRYVHPAGTEHHLASFAGTFYAALAEFNRMSVETRAPMFLLYILMSNSGFDPLRGVLVPSVAIGGHPGCGKSHMGEELRHFVCQSEDADAKTKNADTSDRVKRGLFEFTDEMPSEVFGVPPGDEWQRVRAICLKGVESPCANMPGHHNVGLTSKTKRETTIVQLDMVENLDTGTRSRHETRFTVVKIVGTAGCTNQHLVLPNRFFRRWVTLAIRFKPNVGRDFVANAGEDLGTRTVREEGIVNITTGCRGINAGMHHLNALHAAGGIVFTNTAFLQSLNLASGDAMGVAGVCVRSPGPILKAMMFADALLKMDMLITLGTGLGAPRITDRTNFTEVLACSRVLAYSRPLHAVWAFEYVMGEQLGQVAPAGLAAVVDGLRFIMGGTDEKAKWKNLASGADDAVRLTVSPNPDQKGMSDYAWCPDFFPPGELGEESRCLYVAQVRRRVWRREGGGGGGARAIGEGGRGQWRTRARG